MLQSEELLPRALPPLKSRRAPRSEEIALMQGLAGGPRTVTEGPIGRCVKRGWCRALMVEQAEGAGGAPGIVFALTESGRALLAAS